MSLEAELHVDALVMLPELRLVLRPPPWMADALCKEYDQRLFFPLRGENAKAAKEICGRCAVRAECLEYALAHKGLQGVWGGVGEGDRKRLRRQRRPAA